MQTNNKLKTQQKKSIYFRTNTSYLMISNNSILVMSSKYPAKSPSAIKVSKGLDIELGRNIKQFNNLLSKTRIPIIFEKLISLGGYDNYSILRMQTDDIKGMILGNIACSEDGTIKKIICTKAFKNEADYLRYEEVGSLWRIRSGNEHNEEKNIKKIEFLTKTITDFDMLTNASIETTKSKDDNNKYNVKIKSEEMNYTYTYMLSRITDKFELVTVSLE